MSPNQQKQMLLSFDLFLHEVICHCRFKVDFLEFIQWKSTQVSDIYKLNKRIQFLNTGLSKKVQKGQCASASRIAVEF